MTVCNRDTGRETIEAPRRACISTGASGITPSWPGIDAEGVRLRVLDDATELGRRIVAGARRAVAAVVEVAENLLARGLEVTVVERLDAPMAAALDADTAGGAAEADAGRGERPATQYLGHRLHCCRGTCHCRENCGGSSVTS